MTAPRPKSLWEHELIELLRQRYAVRRGDWIKELNDPSKADAIGQYCHRWWLVVGYDGLAKLDEVPEQWGLLVAERSESVHDSEREYRLVVKRKAVTRQPSAWTPPFIAALVRHVTQDWIPKSQIEPTIKKAVDKAIYDERFRQSGGAKKYRAMLDDLQRRATRASMLIGCAISNMEVTPELAAKPPRLGDDS